jgi:hypothetical protein
MKTLRTILKFLFLVAVTNGAYLLYLAYKYFGEREHVRSMLKSKLQ